VSEVKKLLSYYEAEREGRREGDEMAVCLFLSFLPIYLLCVFVCFLCPINDESNLVVSK